MAKTVLIVEDERAIVEILKFNPCIHEHDTLILYKIARCVIAKTQLFTHVIE